MIRRRKEKERSDDYIGPSKGWAKFFHRLFLLLTFPLRKPLWTLLIVAVLFLAPTFMGVKPAEVHLWYWQHIKNSSEQVKNTVTDKAKQLGAELPLAAAPVAEPQKPAKVVDVPARESRRKMFERAKSAPVVVTETAPAIKEPAPAPAVQAAPQAAVKKKLNLKYLNQPKKISGAVIIHNANELTVGGTRLFLYGIYAEPASENGRAAADFLSRTIADKIVSCEILAYSFQSVATAVCTVDNINLNRELVNLGYSKNVALD